MARLPYDTLVFPLSSETVCDYLASTVQLVATRRTNPHCPLEKYPHKADGTVWVNGVNYGAATQRMLNTYYSRTAMGSVASYVKYLGPTSNADVALSKSIVSFTITAFCTILASCYGLPSSFADLMSNLSQRVLSAANAGNPTSKSLSYKQYKYERSDSIGTDRYYRYIADCYPEANFNGSVSQEIYYQHTYFT